MTAALPTDEEQLGFGGGPRAPWFEVSCCLANSARLLAGLSCYLVTADDTGRLVVDLQPDGDLMFDVGALWVAAVVALTATAGSLYFSEVAGFEPCALCWYQRIAMYPLVLILGIAAAARTYFGVTPDRLTIPQAALLPLLPQRWLDGLSRQATPGTDPPGHRLSPHDALAYAARTLTDR